AAASGAAVPALIPPRRVITLYQCFSVSQRADARYRHLIALFTQDEYFAMVAENESEQESWYLLLSRLILESKRRRCGTPGAQPDGEPAALAAAAAAEPPFYKDVWQVIVKPRGLGHRKELSGVFRLCLTDEEVVFVRLNTEVASVVVQLLSIRRCGHSEQYFFLEVGRSTVIGPGELWMQVDDCVVAQNMHELFLEKMRALCADEYRARCRSYSISIGAHLLTLLSTRRHLDMLPLEPGGWLRRRYITPSEPVPTSRRGRLHLPRARRSRRAISVPASFFRRVAPSPVRGPHPAEAPNEGACLSSEAPGSGSGNSGEEGNLQGKEDQEGNGGDYMPMNNWGSGNSRGSGGGQGSSGQGSSSQSSGGSQCSGRGHGSGGGQGSSGSQGSSGQGSRGQGAGGNQCSGDGQGTSGLWGIIADPRQFAFSNYVNVEFGVPFPNPANDLSDLLRAIPGANPFSLDGARWPLPPLPPSATGNSANEEEGDYIEVIFNPAMTPASAEPIGRPCRRRPEQEDSDDDTYVRMDFARPDNEKFDSPQRGWSRAVLPALLSLVGTEAAGPLITGMASMLTNERLTCWPHWEKVEQCTHIDKAAIHQKSQSGAWGRKE
ncbi:hypothetical protein E2I00_013643, partial [Balaenoptera physalus]